MKAPRFLTAAALLMGMGVAAADEPQTEAEKPLAAPESRPAESSKADGATSEQIERWIGQLGSDEYWSREDANKRLYRAGKAAIGPLSQAARSDQLEVSMRAIAILAHYLSLDDPAIEAAAEAALEDIASSRVTSVAARAEAALDGYRGNRQERLLAKLRQLGANVESIVFSGEAGTVRITIGNGWRGTAADLAPLKRVESLTQLSIYGVGIDDEAIKHLAPLKQLSDLQLYGTKISAAGVKRLQASLPGVKVDHRRGALLGVHGDASAHGGGCLVLNVAPNTAASKAGLQPGDIITKFDGKAVEDFNSLTDLIKYKAGDETVELELQRDEQIGEKTEKQTIKKNVTLGHWTDAAPSVNAEWEGRIRLPGR